VNLSGRQIRNCHDVSWVIIGGSGSRHSHGCHDHRAVDWDQLDQVVGGQSRSTKVEDTDVGVRCGRGDDRGIVWRESSRVSARVSREGEER
jgi:hypothetical protein